MKKILSPLNTRDEWVLVLIGFSIFLGSSFANAQSQATPDKQSQEKFRGHAEYVYTVSLSADGQMMATAAGDNTAIIWDIATRQPKQVLSQEAAVYAAAFRPHGSQIVTADGEGNVVMWNHDGRKMLERDEHQDAVYCLAFSADGKWLATAGGSTDGGDTTIRIWAADGLTLTKSLSGHKRQVYGIAFSPDGNFLATGSSDKTIRLWNLADGSYQELLGHTSDVYRVCFAPDGKRLASVSQDGTLRIWDLKNFTSITLFETQPKTAVYGVVASSDGKKLATVGDDGFLRIWRWADGKLVSERSLSSKALFAIEFSVDGDAVYAAGEDGDVYQLKVSFSAMGQDERNPVRTCSF